jgi:hypothetical protein
MTPDKRFHCQGAQAVSNRWPKALPVLTEEQKRIREDFQRHWLEVLPKRFGLVER